MSLSRLRARLDRLAPPSELGKDRDHDRRRRHELQFRKLAPEGLTKSEERELARLDVMFSDEDRDHNRKLELFLKGFFAKHGGRGPREPLTEAEKSELAELEKRYPPDESAKRIASRYAAGLEKFEQSNPKVDGN